MLIANISIMFSELPLADRFAAARDCGFNGVEIQFPDEADLSRLAQTQRASGLPVVLVNIPRGGEGRAGLAALPGLEADFAAAVERIIPIAAELGARKVNALSGITAGLDPAACRATLIGNLRRAAGRLDEAGLRLMVEPVNPWDVPGFFLTGLAPALAVIEAVDHPNLALQFDLYHMARTEGDLPAAIARAGDRIGHVQFADDPGRGAPGTGQIVFAPAFAALRAAGYRDALAAEYRPGDAATPDTLGWMPAFREMLTP